MTDTQPPSPAQASLLSQTARGAGWVIGWRMTTRGLGVISTLVLVRLLTPSDFGLVALATGFWQAIDALSTIGVEEAIIRERTPSRALYDTGFTLNALRGLATVAIIVGGAWPFAWFFNDDRLVPVMLALAVAAMANGLENIGIVDFRRDLDFRREFVLFVFPRLASMLTTLGLAFVLRSHWALVTGILLSALLRLLGGYVLHPYRPRFSLAAWRIIASFSFWTWMLSMTGLLRDRVDNFVIGRMLGITQVGIYAIGAEIAALPITELVSPLGRACFSAFAAARNTGTDMRATFLRLVGSAALIGLPAGVGLSLVAGPVVRLAFGDRWLGAIGLIQLLGCTLTVTVVGTLSAALLNAHAVLKPQFVVQLIAIVVRLVAMIALVAAYGLMGAAIGLSMALALEHLCMTVLALRRLGLGLSDLWPQLWRSLLATAGMAAGLSALGLGWNGDSEETATLLGSLALAIFCGAAIYALLLMGFWLLARRPDGAERDAIKLLRGMTFGVRREI